MPTKDKLVIFRFRFKPNILLPDKSKDHREEEHECLEENDGEITCGAYEGAYEGGNDGSRVRRTRKIQQRCSKALLVNALTLNKAIPKCPRLGNKPGR